MVEVQDGDLAAAVEGERDKVLSSLSCYNELKLQQLVLQQRTLSSLCSLRHTVELYQQ